MPYTYEHRTVDQTDNIKENELFYLVLFVCSLLDALIVFSSVKGDTSKFG